MTTKTQETRVFYDGYWPANVPDYRKTREHVQAIVPPGTYRRALDGGCGTGVCSLALANLAQSVTAVDLSTASLNTAASMARRLDVTNINYVQASLLDLPFPPHSFDLVFSWGVIDHTVDPIHSLDELVRVMRPGGTLVLAVYLRTWLTPAHEVIRRVCLRLPHQLRRPVIISVSTFVRVAELLGHRTNVRPDNRHISSQVEDWFFVPEKHFFTVSEINGLFRDRRLSFELVCGQTGRFKISSCFIVRGTVQ